MAELAYDVRVYRLEKRTNAAGKVTSFRVCWKVDQQLHRRSFSTRTQADAFRSDLLAVARRGDAFRVDTGEPAAWQRSAQRVTWFVFAETYAKSKWQQASPNHRRGIAESLTDATEALLTSAGGPDREQLRAAMRWAFSTVLSQPDAVPDRHTAASLTWLRQNTVQMDVLGDRGAGATLVRSVLARLNQTKTGEAAAASTGTRKRAVIYNAFDHACETGVITINPLTYVKWTRPRTVSAVDPRIVINADQARRFLTAVEDHSDRGARLTAFFASMYYAGLRPEEAAELRLANLVDLPATPGHWGQIRLTHSVPRSGSRWTDSGKPREQSPLKHRASGDSRLVPMHPELARYLRNHLASYGHSADGHLFVGLHGGAVTDRTYLRVFHEARVAAFTTEEADSPLMRVPYSLRHAAVSTWLKATGDPAQVAAWAGHSVMVLLRVYAKCVDGTQTANLQKILDATN